MSRMILTLVLVVVAAMAVSEAAMQPSPGDRLLLGLIFAGSAVLTVVLYRGGRRFAARSPSLGASVRMVAILAVVVAAATVLLAAGSMFISVHDRNLVLVALGLGVALGVAGATDLAASINRDLERLAAAAGRLAEGDLAARAKVDRQDEVGMVAGAFDRMAERIESAEEERRILLTSIGHDLRTPLASIQAAAEAIIDGVARDPHRYLEGITRDVAVVSGLVDDLVMLARLEAGTFESRPEKVDVRELVDDAVDSLAAVAAKRSVTLMVPDPAPVTAHVDPAGFGRVLRNLLDNAIRHSPSPATVEVRIEGSVVRVIDSGSGFPPDFVSVAFDRFTRADPARTTPGAGLGLAIARALIEADGGRIEVEPGPGGRVAVHLPGTQT